MQHRRECSLLRVRSRRRSNRTRERARPTYYKDGLLVYPRRVGEILTVEV